MPLCQTLHVANDAVEASLQQLQVSLLRDMESFGSRSVGTAETWAESVEGMLTEELDGRLRAHRPRAGRIEEEVRAARSFELLAQRRRVEAHMARQSKAVKQQAAAAQDALQALRTNAAAWKAKLLGYERLLGNAMSLKGVDICCGRRRR
ncbi:hypothetical protein COO60DRAFT_9929 [Scenedesmus sp. NREL 46B-D3]|nr:hypothetical protein COO60DRAFT_9929 [Scenedesmus sp. NREL 46B-D3]